MDIFNVLNLIGGLALFLFGMEVMGNALEKRAGNRLKTILGKLTANPTRGFLLGLIVTAIIQSSSATTVMVVGFVNSGVMALTQSVPIIIGANVGTAVTSWLLSLVGIESGNLFLKLLKPSSFTPILALIGISMLLFARRQRKKDSAAILLGFAVLMYGMEIMSGAVKPLAQMESFTRILVMFSNPLLGVLAGAVLTAIVQSSSASVGILQALSVTGSVTYATAIPIICGQNIGTCITALISSASASRDAKRASVIHLLFNVIGVVFWLGLFYLVAFIAPIDGFMATAVSPLSIAFVHTLFKLLSTALLMPFAGRLEELSRILVKDARGNEELNLLDERLFVTPAVAVARADQVTKIMAQWSLSALNASFALFDTYDDANVEKILAAENRVDQFEDKLASYMVRLGEHEMNESDSHTMNKLLHIIGDLERLSDHAVNLTESAREIHEKGLSFSECGNREVHVLMRAASEILRLSEEAFMNNDLSTATRVEPLEQVIDLLKEQIRAKHIARLRTGECTIEMGFILSDILTNLERISDHCSNIAVCIIEIAHDNFGAHAYLREVKLGGDEEYKRLYEEYLATYALN